MLLRVLCVIGVLFWAVSVDGATSRHLWPVCSDAPPSGFGYRTDPFNGRRVFHSGLDFAVEQGVPVRASLGGRVIAAERRGPYGKMVEIDHGGAERTRYAHLSAWAVMEGDRVAQGQTIGWSGQSGRAEKPLLHFELWRGETQRDPRNALDPSPRCGG